MHPERCGGDRETQLLGECETVMRERVRENNSGGVGLSVNVATSDEARIWCLSRLGYQAKASTTGVGARPLSAPIPAPDLPAGFGLRSAAGDHEAALLADGVESDWWTGGSFSSERVGWLLTTEVLGTFSTLSSLCEGMWGIIKQGLTQQLLTGKLRVAV